MSVHGTCHTLWQEATETHLCGKAADHGFAHMCACGAILLMGSASLTPEQMELRRRDCPACHARAGRPCHTKAGAVMSGVHEERTRR